MSEIEAAQIAQADAQHDPLLVRATAGRRELDLGRDVHALLGIVFDRIDLDGAAARIRQCIASGRRCFLSTPNVNFVAAATHDSKFRGSVLRSDLSLADGFPIVRIGRAMGVDFPGRVAGADLFERLQSAGRSVQRPPIKLFLFGGPPGVGAQAAARLNAQAGGFECVGHDEGGFGDIEAMSSQATIDRINASGAVARHLSGGESIQFELAAAPALGSAVLGMIALIDAWQVAPRALLAASVTHRALHADLRAHGVEHLLDAAA